MINFRNGSRMLAKLVPYIMSFFGGTRDVSSNVISPKSSFYAPETSSSVWGHAGMNFHEIHRARRKAHRGKMYRRYQGQLPRGLRKAHA
ncbi:MAG: hypothetical protein IMZ61_15995 [Planctomycetes bacterium]|nr:hypothetical protein [Planctomycetota bacterium]